MLFLCIGSLVCDDYFEDGGEPLLKKRKIQGKDCFGDCYCDCSLITVLLF